MVPYPTSCYASSCLAEDNGSCQIDLSLRLPTRLTCALQIFILWQLVQRSRESKAPVLLHRRAGWPTLADRIGGGIFWVCWLLPDKRETISQLSNLVCVKKSLPQTAPGTFHSNQTRTTRLCSLLCGGRCRWSFFYSREKECEKEKERRRTTITNDHERNTQSPCPTCQSLLVTGTALPLDWPKKALWQIAVLVFAIGVDWLLVCFLGHSCVLRSILALLVAY